MPMDHFLEEIVVKKNKTANEILYFLSIIVMVLTALYAVMMLQLLFYAFSVFQLIVVLLNAGIAVLLFFFRDRLRTEYEYTFTNGDLDFAMVFNNQKRKSLGSLKVNKVEAFGPVNGNGFQRFISMPGVKKNNWFLNRGSELYFFYVQKENNKRVIIFEPSEEMVGYVKQYLPRGTYQE